MKLEFIPLDRLVVSKANMRHARKAPDVSDILPTVRARGVLQPVIVRPHALPASGRASGRGGAQDAAKPEVPEAQGAPATDLFEIIAGSRRFHAARLVREERVASGEADAEAVLLPCAVLDAGDDAAAVEASLIENLARLDPDEVTQWETFTRLVREGRKVADIAATFGLPELTVRRVLALGNLLPAIRELYRREEIDAASVRHLTLASKSQQKAWLALADDPDSYAPSGHHLKAWLFGGQSIPARHALFDVEASGLATLADLFGEDRYFTDAEAFWSAQNAAIAARAAACLEEGWADAIVVPPAEHFAAWEYEKMPKRKGGRVYLDVRASGEVIVHEGYVSRKEAARRARRDAADGDEPATKPARPEVTATMQGYIDLHRHAAVRAALTGHPGMALRLMVAHAIAGSPWWSVRVEPQRSGNEAVAESLLDCRAEADFDAHRRVVLAHLGFSSEEPTVVGGAPGLVALFLRLLELPDAAVLEVIACVMGETLACGSAVVEAVGLELGVDMARVWQADDAFFAVLRDREVLGALVAEVAGEAVAEANRQEKTATLKRIVRDHLGGEGGRTPCPNWVPRWMAFPPSAYTARGGVGTVAAHACVEAERDHLRRAQSEETPASTPPEAMAREPEGSAAQPPDTGDGSDAGGGGERLAA